MSDYHCAAERNNDTLPQAGDNPRTGRMPFSVRAWAFVVKALLRPLEFLDSLWDAKGFSNGFFVQIVKK